MSRIIKQKHYSADASVMIAAPPPPCTLDVAIYYGALLVPKIVLQVEVLFLQRVVNQGRFS